MREILITFSSLGGAGRLGNQLWQIASTLGIARSLGDECVFPRWDYQEFFSVPETYFGDPLGTEAQDTNLVFHIDRRARIYLQDLGLFAPIADEIRSLFAPSIEASATLEHVLEDSVILDVDFKNATAIHVRRGDYVTNDPGYLPPCPLSYYVNAWESLGGEQAVVFSDDQAWVESELIPLLGSDAMAVQLSPPRPNTYDPEWDANNPPAPTDWMDLQAMAKFGSHVISNSTYSWWAAWLAGGRKVCFPSVWFGENLAYIDASLMIPKDWVQIEC